MGVEKIVKRVLTFGLEPSKWIGVDNLKENGGLINRLVQGLLGKNKKDKDQAAIPETFQQAVTRHEMTKDDIKGRQRLAVILLMSYLIASLALLVYGVVLIASKGFLLSPLVCFILAMLLLVNAVREHIVYYQFKLQRSNITLAIWYQLTFKRCSQ